MLLISKYWGYVWHIGESFVEYFFRIDSMLALSFM